MLAAKFRARLSVSKEGTQQSDMEKYDLKNFKSRGSQISVSDYVIM
jgi:hypothetical protein